MKCVGDTPKNAMGFEIFFSSRQDFAQIRTISIDKNQNLIQYPKIIWGYGLLRGHPQKCDGVWNNSFKPPRFCSNIFFYQYTFFVVSNLGVGYYDLPVRLSWLAVPCTASSGGLPSSHQHQYCCSACRRGGTFLRWGRSWWPKDAVKIIPWFAFFYGKFCTGKIRRIFFRTKLLRDFYFVPQLVGEFYPIYTSRNLAVFVPIKSWDL